MNGQINQVNGQAVDADIPYGSPVAGRPGLVNSPYSRTGGFIDVSGYQSGSKIVDPYTGRLIRVP
jgi:hypothetical protein